MSESQLSKHDHLLMMFFSSLQAEAMMHMGKIQNPATGEIQRNLEAAQATIDILDMLKVKCRTDTPADLLRYMDNSVMELQMNFLDEKKKDAKAAAQEKPEEKAEQEQGTDEPEADKKEEPVSEIEAASAALKPGERKVISDGSAGPVIEIIRKTGEEEEGSEVVEEKTAADDATEKTGE